MLCTLQSTLTGEYSKAKRAEDTLLAHTFAHFLKTFLEDIEKDRYFVQ